MEENDDDNRTVRGRMLEDADEDETGGPTAGSREEEGVSGKNQEEEGEDEASGAKEAQKPGGREDTARQRGAVILGLKLAGSRLHLVFRGHAKATENWVFRGAELQDSRWHTLVLAVTGQRARLTVDCGAPVDM